MDYAMMFRSELKCMGNNSKNKQAVLHQTKKFLHSKGNSRVNDNLQNERKYL
jgi:hypothetical protein